MQLLWMRMRIESESDAHAHRSGLPKYHVSHLLYLFIWWLNFLYKQIFELEKIDRRPGIEPGSLDYMPSVIPLDHQPSLLLEAKMVGGLEVWHSACNRGTRVRFPVDDQSFQAQIFAYRENLVIK